MRSDGMPNKMPTKAAMKPPSIMATKTGSGGMDSGPSTTPFENL